MRTKLEEKEFIIPKETSWHYGVLKPESTGKYTLIEPAVSDIAKVVKAYSHHPMAGYNIAEIKLVYNGNLNRMFEGHMSKLNSRKGNKKYEPLWRIKLTGDEKLQREGTHQKLLTLAQPWVDHKFPHVKLLPMWHGTNDDIAQRYIFDAGYGIFTSNDPSVKTDPGFFGVGVYTAHEAEYAFRVYAQKYGNEAVLLLNWVSVFEAYPVIGQDHLNFQGITAGQDQCDAHFIPVYSGAHPTASYYPCSPDQEAQYHEVVVFDEDQCLPRYRVKLVENSPKQGIGQRLVSDDYQRALDNMACYRYGKVAGAFEEAHKAGDCAAIIRLHWLHSGASGVIAADEKALQHYQNIPKASFDIFGALASFKGENDSEAQFILGWCYQNGLGVDKNFAIAAKYYWMAVNQGHRDAQYHLGVCCASGIGVKPDVSQAIVYYEQAAAQGHVHAHYVLSQCYELGLGTQTNPTKALEHKQAAQQHPQLVGAGLPQTTSVSTSPNVQLEQEVKQLKQQLTQQTAVLKEKELQLTQQIATLNQKDQQLKQQQDKAVQDQQKIKELAQAVSTEQQASRSKDELIARQKEEQRKKDDIIVKQTQEKAAQEIQLRDKDQWLEQQTQKITDLVKELQLTQQKLGQKDEMLNNQWYEIEQLKKDLAESKEREVGLKREFEANKPKTQSSAPQPQSNPYSQLFSSDLITKPAILNAQQQEKQNQLVAACLRGDLTFVKQLESQGSSFSYPNQEGLYPLVAAVYGCSLETVRYVESKLKNEAEKQWSQVDVNKAKTELDRWTPTELSKNATYGELGKWYVKYQGASWCMYYDTECLKLENRKNWGGWNGRDDVNWELGGSDLWGSLGVRVKWLTALKRERERIIGKSRSGTHTVWGQDETLRAHYVYDMLVSPTQTVHDDVVKIIREQLNTLRSEVETKVKRSSAAVFNPQV